MPDPVPLAYCTNVVPTASLDDVVHALGGLWTRVREQLAGDAPLRLGLWFPSDVAAELASREGSRARLAEALRAGGFELVTVNAFPARAFHAPVVKERVYEPHWRDPARSKFTLDVAHAVAALVPEGAHIPVSTLPLGYPKWTASERDEAAVNLLAVADELARIEERTGRRVSIAIEPEPACALETTAETVAFFEQSIWKHAGDPERARRHLGVCLDLCHAAVEHESPVEALDQYAAAGIDVFKVQVSAALEVPDATDPAQRAALERFVEPRWLHQVGVARGHVVRDLPVALASRELTDERPWRVHFHVPVHLAEVAGLPTTRPAVEAFLQAVRSRERAPLLEVETYTWSVVPQAQGDMARGIAAELAWCASQLAGPAGAPQTPARGAARGEAQA